MKRLLRYILLLSLLTLSPGIVSAQQSKIRCQHQVKKKETIFGISRMYGITIEELIKANPEMNAPDYELRKDAVLRIPYSKAELEAAEAEKAAKARRDAEKARAVDDVRKRAVRLGVMLPLHDINGDGRRMTEY